MGEGRQSDGGTLIIVWDFRGKKFKQSTKMKGLFKSKPCIPADVVRQTRDLLLFVDRIPETRESKCEEKLGNFIHYMATFVFGFVVGFTAVWQLALVTLAVVPIIAVIGGINTTTLAKLSIFTPTEYTITGHCSLW